MTDLRSGIRGGDNGGEVNLQVAFLNGGFSRDAAARISFLMAIPVTTGAVVWKMAKLLSDGIPDGLVAPMLVGIVTSGLSGWLAVWGTIRLVRTRSFMPFVVYRIVLGVVVLLLIATGVR